MPGLDWPQMSGSEGSPGGAPPVEHLILDIGGVILPSAMPQVIAGLSAHSSRSEQELWRFFNAHLFAGFWSGRIGLDEFWATFTDFAAVPVETGTWRNEMVVSMLRPFAHIGLIRRWTDAVSVGVLSNQRAEWVLPVLAREGLLDLLDPILISSLTGLVKPDPRAFAQLAHLGPPPARVLYVDDRPHALEQARLHGLTTLLAGVDDGWPDRVSSRLGLDPKSTVT